MKIKLRIVIPVLLGIVLLLSLLNTVSNRRIYSEAEALLAEGKIPEARAIFETVADYKDSTDRMKECDYRNAEGKLLNEEFVSAVSLFARASGFNDADQRCRNAYYVWYDKCVSLYQEGNIVRATLQAQRLREKADGKYPGMVFKASWLLLKAEMGFHYE